MSNAKDFFHQMCLDNLENYYTQPNKVTKQMLGRSLIDKLKAETKRQFLKCEDGLWMMVSPDGEWKKLVNSMSDIKKEGKILEGARLVWKF